MPESKILDIDFGSIFDELTKIKNATRELKEENDKLADSIKKDGDATGELNKQLLNNEAQLRSLSREQRTLNKVVDDNIKSQKAQKGSIEANRAELARLTAEYVKLSKPTAEQTARLKTLSDTLKQQEAAIGDNRRSVGSYSEAIQKAIPGLGNIINGVKGFNTALKANPVGAFVGLLAQLATYLTSNAKVADLVSRVFGGVNKIFSFLTDTIVTTVSSLDNLTEALVHPIDFLLKLGKGMAQAGKEGYQAAAAFDELTKSNAKLGNEIAKNEQKIKAETFALKDRTKTEKERIEIAERIAGLEVKNADLAAERAQKELDAENLKLKGKTLSAEQEARLGDLKAAVEIANSEKEIAQQQKQTRINILLDKQEKESAKDLATDKKQQVKTQQQIEEEATKEKAKALQQRLAESKIYFEQQEVIEKQNFADGVIKEQEFQDRLKEIKVSAIADQLDILQTSGEEIQAKQIELQNAMLDNEINFIKAQKENDKQGAADALEANIKQVEDFRAIQESKLVIAEAVQSSLGSLLQIFAQKSGAAAAFSKVLALYQIAIDTARSISAGIAGATTSATATGPGAFVATPVFIATTIATILGAVAQATKLIKGADVPKPPKLAEGGEVGKVVDIRGKSHAAGGSEISIDGVPVAIAERDEKLFVMKKNASRFIERYSMINQLHGGRSWKNQPVRHAATGGEIATSFDGGFAARQSAFNVEQQLGLENLANVMRNLPTPVVKWTEFNRIDKSIKAAVNVSEL